MKLIHSRPLLLAFLVVGQWICIAICAIPGGRYGAATWYYNNELWMFGGNGWDETSTSAGLLSDMWKYDTNYNMWTFVAGNKIGNARSSSGAVGAASANYNPGGTLNACAWVDDTTNSLWIFGGQVGLSPQAYTNAVWNFNTTSDQWATMSSKTTVGSYGPDVFQIGPRAQHKCASFGSDVYISGGQGYNDSQTLGYLGDLWYFNASAALTNNSWSLLNGNETLNCPSTLGNSGTPASEQSPACATRIAVWTAGTDDIYFVAGPESGSGANEGSHYTISSSTWTSLSVDGLTSRNDSGAIGGRDGKAYLFGGYGLDSSGFKRGFLADLSTWDGTTWKYLTGPVDANPKSQYPDEPGAGDITTHPGGRRLPMMWLDDNGDVWLFGGYSTDGPLNDMWKYTITTGIWTWIGGSQLANQNGNYTNEVLPPVAPPVFNPLPSNNATAPDSSNNNNGLSDAAKIAIGVVVPVVVIGVGLLVLLLLLNKRKKNKAKKAVTTTVSLTSTPNNGKYENIQPNPSPRIYSHIAGPDGATTNSSSKQNVDVPITDSRLIPYTAITLEKEIGEGSFGKVYVGKLRTTKVAIKVANTKMSQDEFIREANFQLAIPPHPNIVQLLGISIDGPQPLVVLEYCNEGSLDKLLFETKKLRTPAQQIALAEAIARGVDHLHQNNIVHRDLAVRNILMHHDEPKISDFGMSRKLKEMSQVSKTAATIGPLRWMAPEALGKQVYSAKSDVWSFGMILYEIVAHQEPHANEDLISVAIKIRDEGYTPIIPDDCPQVLREVMQKCWNADPDQRPDMGTICALLEKT